ncbi:Rne/Rng family ribonuclease [Metallococcus carri]
MPRADSEGGAVSPQDDLNPADEASREDTSLFSASQAPADPAPEPTPPAPASGGAAFGLLFQAPDLEARAPRRATSQATAPAAAQDEPDRQDDTDSGDDDAQAPRSRRRGGRGRRGKADADNTTGDTAADDKGDKADKADTDDKVPEPKGKRPAKKKAADKESTAEGNQGGEADDAGAKDDAGEEGGSSRRRTRRRRRSGNGDSEDPPGTVTKVREPRKDRDEVTAIKGSTRLEAKKQRRREGREAGRRRTVITEAEFLARRESVERDMVVREKDGRTQIGVLEDGVLVEHYVSRESQSASMAGNVYLGRVQNVLPSMEAAFVDIGRGRNAVLYAGEVNWDAAGLDGQPKRIEHALKSGETVLVQVTKDPIGHKGARLTSQISLPGRFLVYVPGNAMTGISRKLPDTERARLKKILKEIVPEEAGVIVRTAAEGASEEDLKADIERLQGIWAGIEKAASAKSTSAPSLLHGEPDLMLRVVRDVFNEDFRKIVVSGDTAWAEVSDYLSAVAPDLAERAQKWTGEKDVFAEHRIDEQLAKAMDRKVWLPSGGSLIIDRTEAMTVIDVNTGKFVGSGGNLEETVTKNNLEAAEEIVRQLRLRDIGGIIVVDFIDMVLESNRDLVVRRLLECLGRDRTKHQVAEVTSLGLVQMTRKRVGSGLVEVFSEPCEHCGGRGIIIHADPVEKSGNGEGGNTGGGGNGGGRSRRGRGRKNDNGTDHQHDSQPKQPSGPTAAQIAAAAHAAATAHVAPTIAAPSTATDSAPTGSAPTDSAPADSAPAEREPVPATSTPAPAERPLAPESPATEVTGPVTSTDSPAGGIPTKTRRKRKRVVAPAGPPTGGPATDLAGTDADQ